MEASKQALEAQPAQRLAMLLDLSAELAQIVDVNLLLAKILDRLFTVFHQADHGIFIVNEEGKLIPKVIKTRRGQDESNARFSPKIVNRCLETAQAFLTEDATADQRSDLSQSIAESKIRSVMCAPLTMKGTGKAFGVIQLDTQDRHKKFTQDDLHLLMAVAGQAAISVSGRTVHS